MSATITDRQGSCNQKGICDGVLGQMQRGMADFGGGLFMFPLDHENISQGQVFWEDSPHIISLYNCTRDLSQVKSKTTDVMEAVKAFDGPLWGLILLFLLMFWTLFCWHYRNHKLTINRSLWHVVTFILEHDEWFGINRISCLLALLLDLFFFWIQNYWCNLMSTDMITVDKPQVIKNYDDVINRDDLIPMWILETGYFRAFELAVEGTKENLIWQKAMRIGRDKVLTVMEIQTGFLLLDAGRRQKLCGLEFGVVTSSLRNAFARVLSEMGLMKGYCSWNVMDHEASKWNFGFAARKDWLKSFEGKRVMKTWVCDNQRIY